MFRNDKYVSCLPLFPLLVPLDLCQTRVPTFHTRLCPSNPSTLMTIPLVRHVKSVSICYIDLSLTHLNLCFDVKNSILAFSEGSVL